MVIESKSPLRKWWLQRVVKWEGFGCPERHVSRAEPHSWHLSPLGEQCLDSQRLCVHLGTLLSPGAKSTPKPRPVGSRLLRPGRRCIRPLWLVGFSCCSCRMACWFRADILRPFRVCSSVISVSGVSASPRYGGIPCLQGGGARGPGLLLCCGPRMGAP